MKIHIANEKDINSMVELDKKCFGTYGSDAGYFLKKLNSPSGNILVAYDDKGEMVGFSVFEILDKETIPNDFCDLKIKSPIKGKWVHMVAFTTLSKYLNRKKDSELLIKSEQFAKAKGCVESYVPLSKYHPFKKNKVFEFWEENGYRNCGEIKWMAKSDEFIECFFYRKVL